MENRTSAGWRGSRFASFCANSWNSCRSPSPFPDHAPAINEIGLSFYKQPGEEHFEYAAAEDFARDVDGEPGRPAEAEEQGEGGQDGGEETGDGEPLEEMPGVRDGYEGGGAEEKSLAARALPILPFVFVGDLGIPPLLSLRRERSEDALVEAVRKGVHHRIGRAGTKEHEQRDAGNDERIPVHSAAIYPEVGQTRLSKCATREHWPPRIQRQAGTRKKKKGNHG